MPPAQQRPDLHIPRLGPAPARAGAGRAAAPPDPNTDVPSVLPWLAKRIALLVLGILVLALAFSIFKNAFTGFLLLFFPLLFCGTIIFSAGRNFGLKNTVTADFTTNIEESEYDWLADCNRRAAMDHERKLRLGL